MAPPSVSGSFTPGTVCVSASHVLHSTPVSPDQYGSDGSLTIVTGSDGICHTTAAGGDTQVIRVGEGIPADIVPQDAPSASDLQTYLNQVFGAQANLYFTVTRSDFSCDYDVYPKDGTLEVDAPSAYTSNEENVIYATRDSTVSFNLYYVKSFMALEPSIGGLVPDPRVVGVTHYRKGLAVISDSAGAIMLETSAHEVGHLLDLGHTDSKILPDGHANPAWTGTLPDPSPDDRLMYPFGSGSNTLLVKPEWDTIRLSGTAQ